MRHPEVGLKLRPEINCSKSIDVMGVADTGAQSDLWSLDQFLKAGFRKSNLSLVSLSLVAANRSPIKISGAFIATLEGQSTTGSRVRCRTMVYVRPDVRHLYLSYNTMFELGILNRDFPSIGTPDESSDHGLKTPVRTRHSRQEPVLGLRALPVTPCIPDESSGDRSTTPARPKRSRQPPKQYEPESGEWVRFESPNK